MGMDPEQNGAPMMEAVTPQPVSMNIIKEVVADEEGGRWLTLTFCTPVGQFTIFIPGHEAVRWVKSLEPFAANAAVGGLITPPTKLIKPE